MYSYSMNVIVFPFIKKCYIIKIACIELIFNDMTSYDSIRVSCVLILRLPNNYFCALYSSFAIGHLTGNYISGGSRW